MTSLDDLLQRCRRNPGLFVHFPGGSDELARTSLAKLRPLPFKWKLEDPDGSDWIDGSHFLQLVLRKRRGHAASTRSLPNEGLINYADKAGSLTEIVSICEQQGAAVLVGFEGGRSALRRASAADLRARQFFKWDWTDRPIGVKDRSNWIPGDEFLAILDAAGTR